MPDDAPDVPRFRWTKRLLVLCVAALLLAAGAVVLFEWESARRERALFARLGWDAVPPETHLVAVRDDANPAFWATRAAEAVPPRRDGREATPGWNSLRHLPEEPAFDALYAATLADARRAREAREAGVAPAWVERPGWGVASNAAIDAGRVLGQAAARAHARGDVGEALTLVYEADVLAEATPATSLLNYLVVAHTQTQAANLAWDMARESGDAADAWRAARPQGEALITRLLDPTLDEGRLRATFGHAPAEHYRNRLREGPVLPGRFDPPRIGPTLVRLSAVREAAFYHEQAALAEASDTLWPLIDRALALGPPPGHLREVARPGEDELAWSGNSLRAALHGPLFRRLAGVPLAVALYRLDHGRVPETLDDLVPGYLPFVPTDPFSRDAAPLRYDPGRALPVVWSAGWDGVDDGGSLAAGGLGGNSGGVHGRRDIVLPLAPSPTGPDDDPWEYLCQAQPHQLPEDDRDGRDEHQPDE